MQLSPAPAKPPHHAVGRGRGQRNKQYQRRHADRDVRALGDILQNHRQVEPLVETGVNEEMQQDVKKGEQAEHPAEANQPVPAGHAAQGRNGQGDEKELQPPFAATMDQFLDGIGAQGHTGQAERLQQKDRQRDHAQQENHDFQGTDRARRQRFQHQKFLRRSRPS